MKKITILQKVHRARLETIEKVQRRNGRPVSPDVVRAQVQAFKLLGRNLDLPPNLQKMLVESSLSPQSNGTIIDNDHDDSVQLKTEKQRSEGLGIVAETIIKNRITQRLMELERLPLNLGTVNSATLALEPPDNLSRDEDLLKVKALLELKSLRLLTKQKSLRQHIIYNVAPSSNKMSQSMAIRASHRRVKVQSAQELRLSEQLELQQRMERERREREVKLRHAFKICSHTNSVHEDARLRKSRAAQLGKAILQGHNQIEREESRRAERTAKQRLQALRANDEEAYIKLLDQTKDTRITHLLRQTNAFLDSLAQRVKVQQLEAGNISADTSNEVHDAEKIDYYEVAHRIKETVHKQPSILVGGTLKEYQIKGLQWMVSLYNNNLNGILADEMGLGKTIQSISLITYLVEVKRQPGPFLVIVPLSTLTNWTMEFEKWAPSLKKVVYKGPPNARKSLQGVIRSDDFQVLLTTYEYIIKDRPILSKIKWTHMIIDEGHRMKNTNSKLSFTLTQYYFSKHRLILTGTPLQNNLPELWALLNFVLPKIFNSVKTFDDWFNTPFANTGGQDRIELTEEETLLIIRRLHKVLRPFLLRRLKKDVEKDLPDKVEKVIKCKMSALQIKLYDQMLKHNVLFIGESDKSKLSIKGLNNKIMQLRKICNHPFVFEEVENLVNPTRANTDMLWRVAGKFELLDRVLPKFKATGHRVLIFFQMTQVMDIMEDYMRLKGLQYLRLDGSTKAEDRSELLKLFNAPDSPYFAFLLSTRAGGLGLNLQTADTVIIYDTDWNPHQDLQAQDRAHRIGQTREVRILRLITEDTVEEVILQRAHAKLEIDGKVIQAGKFDNKSTAEEQEAFLRSLLEAEELRREQNEEDEDMDDDELNVILARDEEEHAKFRLLDEERILNSPYGRDRLMSSDELPEEYTKDIAEALDPQSKEILGRGARERKIIYYDDGLTEEQWLDAVDNDNDSIESAIERKRKRQERRQEKLRRLNELNESGRSTPEEQEDASEPCETLKRVKVEPGRKGKRGRPPRISLTVPEDPLSTSDREIVTGKSLELLDAVRTAEDDMGRYYSEIFQELPSKKLYPDYYQLIERPIALNVIENHIKSNRYTSLENVKADLDLMLENARTYNEPGSFVYENANALQTIIDEKYPDLTTVVNGSANGNGRRKSSGKRRSSKLSS